jgi:hypothetical protein
MAGNGQASFGDGIGSQARLSGPYAVAVDASGNVYVAADNVPRKINPAGGAHAFFCTCGVPVCSYHHVSNGLGHVCIRGGH